MEQSSSKLLSSDLISSASPEIKAQIEDLSAIRKEFEDQKAELNFFKAKKLKIETLMRRDQIEIANSLGQDAGPAIKVTNLSQIYQGEWVSSSKESFTDMHKK